MIIRKKGNKMKYLSIVAILIAFVGCGGAKPIPRIAFPIQEYKALAKTGTGIVEGQAFLRTRGGDVKVGAGSSVILNPRTSYSDQWYQVNYLQRRPMEMADYAQVEYHIETIADAEGRFSFSNVPPGQYYATTKITWEAPVGYNGSLMLQGDWISKRIIVKDNATTKVILTR